MFQAEANNEGFLLSFGKETSLLVRCFMGGDIEYDKPLCSVMLWTPNIRESEWRMMRHGNDPKEPVGVVFPALTLDPDSRIFEEESKPTKDFATSAVYYLLNSEGFSEHFFEEIVAFGGETTLSEIFGKNLAVAVFDEQQLDKFGLKNEDLIGALLVDGFRVWSQVRETSIHQEHRKNRYIVPVTPDLRDIQDSMIATLDAANRAESAASCFLLLYQIIEIVIDRIFSHLMNEEIVNSEDNDPWIVRDKITEIVKEKNRLQRIETDCLPSDKFNRIKGEIVDICSQYLREVDLHKMDGGYSWDSALYRVRNVVVHRGYSTISDDHKLDPVCRVLRKFIGLLMESFSLPR